MDIVESIIGDSEILHITAFAFIERKDLFRDELFKCHGIAPEDMSAREVMESGQCGCLDLDLDDVSYGASDLNIAAVDDARKLL